MPLIAIFCLTALFLIPTIYASCQGTVVVAPSDIERLRDSLDAIDYAIPQMPKMCSKKKVVKMRTYEEWKDLETTLKRCLDAGYKNIIVKVQCDVKPGDGYQLLQDFNYPEVNIRIDGSKAKQGLNGSSFSIDSPKAIDEGAFYSLPYNAFFLDDFIADEEGNELPLREEVQTISGEIVKVQGLKFKVQSKTDDIWKFQIDLPDLSEEQCKDFYVLMTRNWTSARHKVVMVMDGWLYYHLDSDDVHSTRNPNVDWTQYKVRPRYRLINSPISKGVHVTNGRIYIPKRYRKVTIQKGARILTVKNCHLKSLEVRGFTISGCGKDCLIGVNDSKFETGMFITNNHFSHLNYLAIIAYRNENLVISNNTFSDTRGGVYYMEGGAGTTICANKMKNIGWMQNSNAIQAGGERLHICDNVIEDFNYGAIAVGSTTSNDKAGKLTYIIERNTIRLTKEFTDNYIQNTLADGGGIYIGPQCKQGIIRNNVVENIKGIHSNRGIFLDDGAKNLAIYGNYIMNTANSYDIDLRYSAGYAKGIPDHNTNNSIFQNIMTGGYRFQDAGEGSNCIGGENVLLGTGKVQKTVVELKRRVADMDAQSSKEFKVQGVLDSMPVDGFVKKQISSISFR